MQRLILWTARHHVRPSFRLTFDDLVGEANLIFARCCQKFRYGNFIHYFKRAWYNKLRKLHRSEIRKPTLAELPLDDLGQRGRQRPVGLETADLRKLLSRPGFNYCREMLNPSAKTERVAWRDFTSNGRKTFRVRPEHVARSLRLTREQTRNIKQELAAKLPAIIKRG